MKIRPVQRLYKLEITGKDSILKPAKASSSVSGSNELTISPVNPGYDPVAGHSYTTRSGRKVKLPNGEKRTARVRTGTGMKIRPVQRLYKLEITGKDSILKPAKASSSVSGSNELTISPVNPGYDPVAGHSYTTRSGRKVKLPSKFSLYIFNCIID
ncbi:hypothetical protein ACJJTC_018119 [Scirpophaga incertulas]